MMLVQKQPHFSMALTQSPYIYSHRRHPSAPPQAAVVQPTRTPGLLTLSKPPRASKGSPKPRNAQAASRATPEPPVTPLKPAAEIRGRQQGKKVHQQQQRSSSHAAPSRRRQPSPDPFKAAPAPNKRRQLPIPIPKLPSPTDSSLSRSDPVLSHMPRRKPQRSATLDVFPICDDTTEVGTRPSSPEPEHSHTPTNTPTRARPTLNLAEPHTPPRRTRVPEAPRTAPLSSAGAPSASFPFPSTSTPSSSPKRRPATAAQRAKHLSEGGPPVRLPEGYDFVTTPRRSRSTEPVDDSGIPDYFASSMFQNSPSPEELPPPLFTILSLFHGRYRHTVTLVSDTRALSVPACIWLHHAYRSVTVFWVLFSLSVSV
ncbi:hypothetical protein FB45DRAFT_472438 [Roridomyces roridus]|uniref:Uncharacterized protein n=1 Tax=Roridomyces roridus TaxID=1738132 RepID=A0AAD7BZA7_9AGAR|nr:hypothetical protein FB45DRAFT_472438 [Roridomyces roridus]